MTYRIGFACKWIDHPEQINGIKPKDAARQYNTGGTTVRWLREHPDQAEEKLWTLLEQNTKAALKLVEKVGTLDAHLRMVRLSSDILSVYTEPSWIDFWQQADIQQRCQDAFRPIGQMARDLDVRLSFHPGQFCVLASDNDDIVRRSILEFEYHADMARWMGYGRQFQDFKINVHIAGRRGPEGIRQAYQQLTPEARNCITIENEENSWGLDDCLSISDVVPIVLDIHHNWVREGTYIDPASDAVKRVVNSWRGVRPAMHYSVSREDYLVDHCGDTLPDYHLLLESGHKKAHLRAHSDFYWNRAVNAWAFQFTEVADLMCESKAKNLASERFYIENR